MDSWLGILVGAALVGVLVYLQLDYGGKGEPVFVRAKGARREGMGIVQFALRVRNKQLTDVTVRRVSVIGPRGCLIRSSNLMQSQVDWNDSARVNARVSAFSVEEFPMTCRLAGWALRIQLELLIDRDESPMPPEKRVTLWLLGWRR